MPNDDIRAFTPHDILSAIGLLSRIPVPVDEDRAQARGAEAAWAFPVAGLVIGAIACLVTSIWLWLGMTPALAAVAVLAVQVIITGAMHEDGLADSADGLWGGWDKARRLEIMKDSRIGTYGVLALGLSLVARWVALDQIIGAGCLWAPVITAAVISRVPMVALMHLMPNARDGGLSSSVGRPRKTATGVALLAGLVIATALSGWIVIPLFIFLALATLKVGLVAQAKIGGQTGDILGAMQQVAEITALAVLASVAV